MKKYDYRFDTNLLQSFIGQTFQFYKHKKFMYTNTVSVWLEFMIKNRLFRLNNDFEEIDYFGWDDEATICQLEEVDTSDSNNEEDVVDTNVQEKIESIVLVDDHFCLTCYGKPEYDFWETRAIIFKFKEYEISFEKQDSWFSLEIEMNRGYNLIDKIEDEKFILEDFNQIDQQKLFVEREIKHLL